MRRVILLVAALAAVPGLAAAAEPAGNAAIGPVDRSADPCSDFFKFACTAWNRANPIPPDQSRWTRFDALNRHTEGELHALLDRAVAERLPEGRKVADYYAACLDEAAIDAKGLAPLQPELARIAALEDKRDLPALLAHLQEIGVDALFDFGAEPDSKDSAHNIAAVEQGGMGLPDRDYYLRTDERSARLREQYRAHVARLLGLAGDSAADASTAADTVLKLETALASHALTRVQRRDPLAIYHKMDHAALAALGPGLGWDAYFTATGAPQFADLNVSEPDFVAGLDKLLADTPLPELKTYLRWHLLHRAAPMLPKGFVDENFAFYGKVLNGQAEQKPRWLRCVEATDRGLGEALGKLYVATYFPPDAKARVQAMIKDLRAAFAQDIQTLPWMGAETRAFALKKLEAMAEKIGYPDKWRDYSSLAVAPDDALGNAFRAAAFETHRDLKKIGGPVDRAEWRMTPPTINAYYSQSENNINFPAGILQLPFFAAGRDDAANYGAIGAVIGHEMTHGFDDQGRKFDERGNLKDWWTGADAAGFKRRAQCLVDEYAGYTAVDDLHVNGELTLGENTADNGGLRLALMALEERTRGKPAAPIDGFTPEQRFFLGFAQVWCGSIRPEAARLRVQTDPHSPAPVRVNATVSNLKAFADAFHCPADSPMVRKDACRVW